MSIVINFLTFLLQKVQKFLESAQNRQVLWAVNPKKKFTAHQSLREPKIKFWAVGPPIWPPWLGLRKSRSRARPVCPDVVILRESGAF